MAGKKDWLDLGSPGGFSSAAYLARSKKLPPAATKRNLVALPLYQSHRDLRERFPRRSNFATRAFQRWEMDIASLGTKLNHLFEKEPPKPGRKRQLLMLVVVDVFTRAVFAEAVDSKNGKDVTRALERIFITAGGRPQTIVSDAGLEFRNKFIYQLLENNHIRQTFASGLHKARQAERAVRSIKRTIMAAFQTDTLPGGSDWKSIPRLASLALRKRYNRSVGAAPETLSSDPSQRAAVEKREWERASFVPLPLYSSECQKEEEGKPLEEGLAVGDVVLQPIPKQRRAEIRDKEYLMHYSLWPFKVSHIFHARRPYLYKLLNPRTGRKGKRLFYASELKKVVLNVDPKDIEDYRIKEGRLEYLTSRGWVAQD